MQDRSLPGYQYTAPDVATGAAWIALNDTNDTEQACLQPGRQAGRQVKSTSTTTASRHQNVVGKGTIDDTKWDTLADVDVLVV